MNCRTAFCLVAAINLGGCASIVNGQNQSVSVETSSAGESLVGATCTLGNDKGTWLVTTPGSTVVHRSYADLKVKCEKAPLEPGLATAKSSTKAMAFGNILFGGVIGVGVDVATGAAYDYPVLLSVVMGKMTELTTPGGTSPGMRQPKPGDADCALIPGTPICREVKQEPAATADVATK